MKSAARKLLKDIYLYNAAIALIDGLGLFGRFLKRKWSGIDRRILEHYSQTQLVKKLHIGCGDHGIKDWLNADFLPSSKEILHLDATKPFPIKSNTFNYVFSEHMIEHISYDQGRQMLDECYRILKVNGKIRIATPDLSFLIRLYGSKKSDLQERYIEYWTDRFIEKCEPSYYHATFVINNFVREWGHTFIYDEELLRLSLEKSGFSAIVKCELNESEDEVLQNLENEERQPPGFLRLETITLEGTKSTKSYRDGAPEQFMNMVEVLRGSKGKL